MRIGLNLMFLADRAGGAARYVLELVPALHAVAPESELHLFVNRDAPEELGAQDWADSVVWARLPFRFSNRTHLVGQVTALPVEAARRRLDVLHSPANGGPPVTPRVARVVTLLDLIWLHQREAWGAPGAVRKMALLTRISARAANRIITISESAREDIVAHFGLPPDRIDVTPLGVRLPDGAATPADELRRRLGLGDVPVILCVAQKRPYKNLGSLIRALAALDEPAELILPGTPTVHEAELRALAETLGVAPRVHFLDWVSEEDLEGLYRLATCFVLPSLIEGFGLPVLEAMAREVPVACSDRPALPEVAGEAAILFDPENQEAVTESVRRLLADPALRADLVGRGRERVRLFSWRRTAELTLESYERAVAARRGGGD